MFKQYTKWIKNNQEFLTNISDQIWKFAELGFEEYESSRLLVKTLKEHGFIVKTGVADMPTAFYGEYGDEKPIVGILGEYDALPGLSQKPIPKKNH